MKRISVAAALVLVLGFSGAAYSQSTSERGWYIGGSLGEGEWKKWCDGVSAGCDKKDEVWRLFGGYKFSRLFSAELGYADLGKVTISGPLTSARAEATAWDVVGLLALPLGPVSIYGKLGAYYGDMEATSNVPAVGFTGSASETNTDITYGAGVQFDFLRNFAVRGEWQRYEGFGGSGVGGETDMDVYSVALLWRF